MSVTSDWSNRLRSSRSLASSRSSASSDRTPRNIRQMLRLMRLGTAAKRIRFIPQKHCTDWGGQILPPEYKQRLIPGSVIRIIVQEDLGKATGQKARAEAIYLRLIRVEQDGEIAGTVEEDYRDLSVDKGNGLKTGDLVTVTREHVNEIPLGESWQPEEYLELVKDLEPTDEAFWCTGIRDLPYDGDSPDALETSKITAEQSRDIQKVMRERLSVITDKTTDSK